VAMTCICSHDRDRHHGLERKCMSLGCMCPYFSVADTTASRAVRFAEMKAIPPKHEPDPVLSPSYYRRFPNGVEPRHLAGHLTFHLGTALAYVARAGFKGDAAEDIRKAITHLKFELERLGVKK
jgi:hypothetical protein